MLQQFKRIIKLYIHFFLISTIKRFYPTLIQDIPIRALVLSRVLLKHKIFPKRIAEVGVWRGHSSIGFLRLLQGIEQFYLVDTWQTYDDYKDDKKAVADLATDKLICQDRIHFFRDRIVMMQGSSLAISKNIPDHSLDFVFIDANHSYEHVKNDIIAWLPKVRSGGILAGHDIHNPQFPGVLQAVTELFQNDWILEKDATWWIKIR